MDKKEIKKQLEEDKKIREHIELEINAKYEIDRLRKYSANSTTEAILFDMAKSLVQTQKQLSRYENLLLPIIGSAVLGALLGGVLSLVFRQWEDFILSIIILIGAFLIGIYFKK